MLVANCTQHLKDKIDFSNDCSAEWFHWHFAEEADGRSGFTVSKAHYLSWLKFFGFQTHFLTSYTDNSALVTSTKPTGKSKPENIKQRKILMTGQNNNHFLALGHALGEP